VVRYIGLRVRAVVVEARRYRRGRLAGNRTGSALLACLTRRARDEGHSAFRAYVLAINGRSIADDCGAWLQGDGGSGTLRKTNSSWRVIGRSHRARSS